MENTNRIPRVRILERDFPAKIPDGIEDSFLEVINQEGETIALFFLYNSLHKKEFQDGLEFAKYYDDLMGDLEEDEYENIMDWSGVSDKEDIPSSYIDASYKENNSKYYLSMTLMSYGRLKFPYELKKEPKEDYETRYTSELCMDDWLESFDSKYKDDFVDILNFYFDMITVKESFEKFNKIFNVDGIEQLVNLDYEIIGQIADKLFTKDNIGLFIEAANRSQKTVLLAFLLDYKNKHFSADDGTSYKLSI